MGAPVARNHVPTLRVGNPCTKQYVSHDCSPPTIADWTRFRPYDSDPNAAKFFRSALCVPAGAKKTIEPARYLLGERVYPL